MARAATRRGFLRAVGGAAAVTRTVGTASGASGPDAARYATFNVIELETEQVQSEGDSAATRRAP